MKRIVFSSRQMKTFRHWVVRGVWVTRVYAIHTHIHAYIMYECRSLSKLQRSKKGHKLAEISSQFLHISIFSRIAISAIFLLFAKVVIYYLSTYIKDWSTGRYTHITMYAHVVGVEECCFFRHVINAFIFKWPRD